jgi:hypothetical protein
MSLCDEVRIWWLEEGRLDISPAPAINSGGVGVAVKSKRSGLNQKRGMEEIDTQVGEISVSLVGVVGREVMVGKGG